MGKLNRTYNQKARQGSTVDESSELKKNNESSKLVNFASSDQDYRLDHDTSNALVIDPSQKKAKRKEFTKVKPTKILSKKQRKKLEHLKARQTKEKNRGDVLKSLSEHQITSEQLSLFKSTTSIGQVNEKRKLSIVENDADDGGTDAFVAKSGKKKNKRKKKNEERYKNDYDVISLPPISKEDSDEEESDTDLSDDNANIVDGGSADNKLEESEPVDDNEATEEVMAMSAKIDKDNSTKETEIIEKKKDEKETIVTSDVVSVLDSDKSNIVETSTDNNVTIEEKAIVTPKENTPVTPIFVTLHRKNEIQAARLLLPILPEEQVIMETIQENDVIIICGSTGSGKTTQVPQFLYEAGYGTHSTRSGLIGVTEPRRVAAISMANRVADEMNLPTSKVSYQIRFEGNTTSETKIKFMTDGVLLKEMESDFLLTKYSAIIIDEAHERSVYTDILIGMLTRIVPLRKKRGNVLKLVIMSATLRIEDFTENTLLFPISPPVLKVDSRQYPVTIHFNRKTHDDYLTEAFKKVCKIHQTFKVDGGILIFLTGQREVLSLCAKLKKAFPKKGYHNTTKKTEKNKEKETEDETDGLPKIDLDQYEMPNVETPVYIEDDIENYSSGDEDMDEAERNVDDDDIEPDVVMTDYAPLHVLPLYSLLPTSEQAKVFVEVPEGHRLCIISTNVAETSLTLPGIKYIVDSGKVKSKFFDKVTGVSKYMVTWTSKASANQRAGRAGRVGPGHCYRLFSSAVFENNFEEYSEPEIKRRPVDDLVLQMKNMHIDKVIHFPFPSPPDLTALKSAEKLLLELGALKNSKTKQAQDLATITPLGKQLSKIPISPRFAKMIYLAGKKGCVQYIITIAAALAVPNIFTNDIDLSDVPDVDDEDFQKKKIMITKARRKWAGEGPSADLGDLMVVLRAIGASEYATCVETFCKNNGLRHKALIEIKKLRNQLITSLNTVSEEKISTDTKISPPTNEDSMLIREIILSCFGDHVARKVPPEQAKSLKLKNAYQTCLLEDMVFIHPTSSMFTKLPEYVVYHEIVETKKLYMKTMFSIKEEWLPLHSSHNCMLGKPLEEPSPFFDVEKGSVKCYMTSTYGPHSWPLPPQSLTYPNCTEKYRWFSKFFLDGFVCNKLKQFTSLLVTPSGVMLKTWSHLQQRTEDLLCCFLEKEINEKQKLLSEWEKNPHYALSQYLKWLPESQHEHVKYMWPPVD